MVLLLVSTCSVVDSSAVSLVLVCDVSLHGIGPYPPFDDVLVTALSVFLFLVDDLPVDSFLVDELPVDSFLVDDPPVGCPLVEALVVYHQLMSGFGRVANAYTIVERKPMQFRAYMSGLIV